MEYIITKKFDRKITRNYQSWGFETTLTKTIKVETGKQLQEEADKLFTQAKVLTEVDITNTNFEE